MGVSDPAFRAMPLAFFQDEMRNCVIRNRISQFHCNARNSEINNSDASSGAYIITFAGTRSYYYYAKLFRIAFVFDRSSPDESAIATAILFRSESKEAIRGSDYFD